MIRTMFLGKQVSDKSRRSGVIDPTVADARTRLEAIVREAASQTPGLLNAGFLADGQGLAASQDRLGEGFWFRSDDALAKAVCRIRDATAPIMLQLNQEQLLLVDHQLAADRIIPAYLGGLSGLHAACETTV